MIVLLLSLALPETRHVVLQTPPAPPAPPPISIAPAPKREPVLVDFVPGEVRCGGAVVTPRRMVAPRPAGMYRVPSTSLPPYGLSFAIDAEGRPVGIGKPERLARDGYIAVDDLAPALALWRFAPGAARTGCAVSFTPDPQPIATAPIEKLFRYGADRYRGRAGWREVLARLRESDCAEARHPRFLLRGYPDYEAIPQAPGTFSHSIVGFDIDRSGRPVHVRTASSGGNAALDRAAREAVEKSRYVKGDPRTGCTLPFGRRGSAPVPAPASPDLAGFRPEGATCPEKIDWAKMPKLVFPEPFRRRSIEGWAVVRFDVAPWGAPGNVEVVASEPAAAFGDQARSIIGAARAEASDSGATGCVERVRFKMGTRKDAAAETEDEGVSG